VGTKKESSEKKRGGGPSEEERTSASGKKLNPRRSLRKGLGSPGKNGHAEERKRKKNRNEGVFKSLV